MSKLYTEEEVIDLLIIMGNNPNTLYEREYMPDWIKENL